MKRMLWIAGMVASAAVMLVPAPREAEAFSPCMDWPCKRDLDCGHGECPPCNGNQWMEGTCWYE